MTVLSTETKYPGHVLRMIVEHRELSLRVEGLEKFINTNDVFATLSLAEREDQEQQLYGMQVYQDSLHSRLVRAGYTPDL